MKGLHNVRWLALAVLVLLAASCTRAKQPAARAIPPAPEQGVERPALQQPQAQPPQAPSTQAQAQPGPAPGAPAQPAPPPPPAPGFPMRGTASANAPPPPAPTHRTPPRPTISAALRSFGLSGIQALMPEDFSLGPLQDLRTKDPRASAALAIARSYMEGYSLGSVDPALFDPDLRGILAVVLAPPPRPDPSKAGAKEGAAPADEGRPAYRLGQIKLDGDSASLRVRLPGPSLGKGREGLLSLRSVDDVWYVESLSIDPPRGGEAKITFDPGARFVAR
jgi:hypothetical protein